MASTRNQSRTGGRAPACDPQNLITIQQAAQLFNVTDRTIRNWVYDGLLTLYAIGPRLKRIDRTQLVQLAQPVNSRGVRDA